MDVDDHLVAPGEIDVEQGESLRAFESGEAGLDSECLAEDARCLGERHRHPLLQRRAARQRGVVVGVAEFVGGGLGGIDRPGPVQQHERTVTGERHAEGAAGLAVTGLGIDPPFVERTVDDPCRAGCCTWRTPT